MECVATNSEVDTESYSCSKEALHKDVAERIQSTFNSVNKYNHSKKKDIIISDSFRRPNTVKIGLLGGDWEFGEKIEMEILKRLYLDSFLQRAEKVSLKHFVKLIDESADQIVACYEQVYCREWDFPESFRQRERFTNERLGSVIEMVLVDASFIIEVFLRAYKKEGESLGGKLHGIRKDLFLDCNQLPWFILKEIYELAFSGDPNYPSFLRLTSHFFSPYHNHKIASIDPSANHLEGSKHFTDLLRTLQLPFPKENSRKEDKFQLIKAKIMSLYRKPDDLPSAKSKKQEEFQVRIEYLYSAVVLQELGVKFKHSRSASLADIQFHKGELKIPLLRVDESTILFFDSLIIWEQKYYPDQTHFRDYIFLMQCLLKSTEDVDLLIRRNIIINHLGENKAVIQLFNAFSDSVSGLGENSCYANILDQLMAYNEVPHHGWIATLKMQHFSTPWKGVATIAAIILLLLTLIQTICSVISVV
ncbi:hypothetical protein COLO4_07979 [Corchorus olitorius]|uniref:Uncharacterized protein n=1 Tax=Corchorus olitorius TaxID=93759 RepID=A0A1R3KHZ5_9ROSI|nr:hypothetical protein COLO4_07979 [Corchorus olitorius]